jgi:hypothetical protein
MKSVAEDIKNLIVAETSLGLTFAENLFIARMPETPVNCVCLFDSSDAGDDTLLTGNPIEVCSFQVLVRHLNYTDAYTLANALKSFLTSIVNTSVDGTFYLIVDHLSGISQLQESFTKRGTTLLTANYLVRRTEEE